MGRYNKARLVLGLGFRVLLFGFGGICSDGPLYPNPVESPCGVES